MDKNLEIYNSKTVVDWYNNLIGLVAVEKAVFTLYKDLVAGAQLLDIGIGGGRTTAFLLEKCKSYTGIDYSENFVISLKKKYPQANIAAKDARDLSAYPAGSFDFVNFSFNGIDYVDLAGRVKILSEIYRVLKPGGVFFFSTHNKNHSSFDQWPWLDKNITLVIKLKTFIKLIPFLSRKIRNKKLESINTDFAIINDSAHSYSLMTFYTSPAFLRKQLNETGFKDLVFYAKNGIPATDKDLDDWIFVTATKV